MAATAGGGRPLPAARQPPARGRRLAWEKPGAAAAAATAAQAGLAPVGGGRREGGAAEPGCAEGPRVRREAARLPLTHPRLRTAARLSSAGLTSPRVTCVRRVALCVGAHPGPAATPPSAFPTYSLDQDQASCGCVFSVIHVQFIHLNTSRVIFSFLNCIQQCSASPVDQAASDLLLLLEQLAVLLQHRLAATSFPWEPR